MNSGERLKLLSMFKGDIDKLQKMFPELQDSEPVEILSVPNWNDGGSEITIIWEGPGRHTMTQHSDYGVYSPWTTIRVVQRYEHREWRYKDLEKARRYGET